MKFSVLSSLLLGAFIPTLSWGAALPVPFTVQAPEGKWVQPWADACEEATIIMINQYYAGNHSVVLNKKTAISEIKNLVAVENKYLGFNKDTNAAQMVYIINNFTPFEATAVYNPTLEQIKNEIDEGRPVIALIHGKGVNNPYFRNGGPEYHTVVIKGYDDNQTDFITNEPGVGHGLDYRYKYDTLITALHDFLPGKKTKLGEPVVIFTQPNNLESQNTDADHDKATKEEEMAYGTDLTKKDTDNDGYSDGQEIHSGYSPVTNEENLSNGSLIKLNSSPDVYYLDSLMIRKIANEEIFLAHGWKWNQIKIVGPTFWLKFTLGEEIID